MTRYAIDPGARARGTRTTPFGNKSIAFLGSAAPVTIGVNGSGALANDTGNRFTVDADAGATIKVADGVAPGQEIEVSAQFNTGTHTITFETPAAVKIVDLVTGAAAGANASARLLWTGVKWVVSVVGQGAANSVLS